MVRLKGRNWGYYSDDESISIPYGAIKRKVEQNLLLITAHFNSLWCD